MATWDGYNQSIIANRFQKSFMVNYLDLSGRLLVRKDASLNNRLFVMNDASFAGNVYVDEILTANLRLQYNGDAQFNNRLFLQNDASFMGNLYVDDNLTTNLNVVSKRDTSFNSNVVVGRDISCNGNINIGRNITVLGNIAVKNYTATNVINTTTTNYRLAVVEDISLNGRVSVSSDTSLNGNLFVSRDISLNGNLIINNSAQYKNNIFINGMNVGRGNGNFATCTVVGNLALINNLGASQTAIGYGTLKLNSNASTGVSNTCFGYQAGNVMLSFTSAVIGYQSFASSSNPRNIGLGAVLQPTAAANNNIALGANINYSSSFTNGIAIGAMSALNDTNQIMLGTSAETVIIPRIERYLTPPIYIRSISSAISIPHNSDTVILWGTQTYLSPNVPLSYNATTGVFSNTAGYTIGISLTASFAYAYNTTITGSRVLWVQHSSYGRVCSQQIGYNTNSNPSVMNISCCFTLGSSQTFNISTYQNSGAALLASSSYNTSHPCRVVMTVY